MKKLIQLSLLLPFLLFANVIPAQFSHDVKINVFDVLQLDPGILWEINSNKNFSLELGVSYSFDKVGVIYDDPNVPIIFIGFENFRREHFGFSAALKYYFFKHKESRGLFTGIANITRLETYRDPEYFTFYLEKNGEHPEINKTVQLFFGFPVGYKWLIKDRIVLEVETIVGQNFVSGISFNAMAVYPELRAKIGYRFDKKRDSIKPIGGH